MDNIIVEYNNLWVKLNSISAQHNDLFVFTLTSTGAILTFSIQQGNEYIAFINYFILIILRCRVMSYRDDYYRILAYIRGKLEPKLNINSHTLRDIENNKISNLHYFVYALLGIGTLSTILIINISNLIMMICSTVLVLLIVALDIYYFFGSKKLYRKYEEYYRR